MMPPLPPPELTHQRYVDTPVLDYYTPDQIKKYAQKVREAALLDAMNATLPFDKVGRVIAAAIGALK
jgi:hypothetical protein